MLCSGIIFHFDQIFKNKQPFSEIPNLSKKLQLIISSASNFAFHFHLHIFVHIVVSQRKKMEKIAYILLFSSYPMKKILTNQMNTPIPTYYQFIVLPTVSRLNVENDVMNSLVLNRKKMKSSTVSTEFFIISLDFSLVHSSVQGYAVKYNFFVRV